MTLQQTERQLPEAALARPTSVYVHFPWCLAKCPYCDFVSYVTPAIDHEGYADAVLRELETRAPLGQGRRVESVFFGGGTPSLWDPRALGRVLAAIGQTFETAEDLEVTVECNPTSLDEDRARALGDVGVNRLSIGVQSLSDERLRFLGRLHDAAGAVAAVRGAMRAGMPRISSDLIFGLPEQSSDQAREEATTLADLGLGHLSCYQLTIESGTRFGELARRGRLPLADEGQVAETFLAIDEALESRGLLHYEISNYARKGQEARHNLGYWRGHEYVGIGCGAYGFVRCEPRAAPSDPPLAGVRWRNRVTPERYVEATRAAHPRPHGAPDGIADTTEALSPDTLLRERIMLGLRVTEGVDLERSARELGTEGWTASRERASAWLVARGRLVRDGARAIIPKSAWLWADDSAARLF